MPELRLQPANLATQSPSGTPLRSLLMRHGVEFPCGGRGLCRGCRVRVSKGQIPANADEMDRLGEEEVDAGWRLGCQHELTEDLTLELAPWDTPILTDYTSFSFQPRAGFGVAIDLGTTTVAGQLLDLSSGQVLGVRSSMNAQRTYGSDVMSRICFAASESGQPILRALIRKQLGRMVRQLSEESGDQTRQIDEVVIVGNTPMHNLLAGIDITPLSHYPFEPAADGWVSVRASEWGWQVAGDPVVHVLPALGSFVGSDVLAGVLATGMDRESDVHCLIDLGTNGEIVVGTREAMVCASAAAGPAFEAARIRQGMTASTGAIAEVAQENGQLRCTVLGDAEAKGICGSGLVDAVAAGLGNGAIRSSGRFRDRSLDRLHLQDGVYLHQRDIRELQLAKGAIAAGLGILLEAVGAEVSDVARVYLAGAFGNYIRIASARRIGLLTLPTEVIPVGNTALLGAKLALFMAPDQRHRVDQIRAITHHMELSNSGAFQDVFVDHMGFPEADGLA